MSSHLGSRPQGPHFLVAPSAFDKNRVTLDEVDARHLSVRRLRPGDRISVSDGGGRIFQARLESIESKSALAAIEAVYEEPPPTPRVTVLQGLAKGSKVDWAVEKMVELGADRIVVFASGRSVPAWDRAKADAAAERWHRVARAAAKQSRRAWLPEIDGPLNAAQAFELVGSLPLALVADPAAERRLKDALDIELPEEIGLVVGPEGGLDPDEVARFEQAGGLRVALGAQILRTETAGLALAAVVMFQAGRFG